MSTPERIGVVFDMDGVLVDSAEPHFESWRTLAGENGQTVTREQFTATFGRHNQDIVPLLFGPVSDDRITELADRKEVIYRDLIRDDAPVVVGAVALVRALHGMGVRLAVGSSAPPANIELILETMKVRELISVIVSAEDVSLGKPDPQVFTQACERLGIVPSRCVVIEDAPAGVEAGKSAGAKVVAVMTYHPREALAQADLIVERLADLAVEDILALPRAGA